MTDLSSSSDQFLTPEECAEVDSTLMPARDRFSARVAIYALRSLKQIAEQTGVPIGELTDRQIIHWVEQDPVLRPEHGFDTSFKGFFAKLVLASLKPLRQISQENGSAIETLTLSQVVNWFEQQAKLRIQQEDGPPFP
jgi:hypothetical protein